MLGRDEKKDDKKEEKKEAKPAAKAAAAPPKKKKIKVKMSACGNGKWRIGHGPCLYKSEGHAQSEWDKICREEQKAK